MPHQDCFGSVGPNAAKALGKLGDARAAKRLIAALWNDVVGENAEKALGEINDSCGGGELLCAL